MANKKINQLVLKTTIQSTDLFPLGDPTTGQLFKKTVAELQAAIGGAVISVNGLVGTVVLDTDDIQELATPTNRYFTEARSRASISLTTTGNSGASTYSNSTGVLNVPTYTLAGLGGITASFLSGGTGITYNSGTGVISYSGTVYTDSSIRALFSAGTGISYNSSTGAITNSAPDQVVSIAGGTGITVSGTYPSFTVAYSGTVYTDSSIRGLFSGTAPISFNSSTGAISISQASSTTNGFLSSTDWTTFNSKQNALTLGNVTEAVSNVLMFPDGGTNKTVGNLSIQVVQSGASTNGYLSSTDWNTFNNKQNAITLTTTGTSGAATFSGGTLNIPQYQAVLTNPVTGTGTTNYVTKWTSSSAIGNSQIFDNGTNVGVGTASTVDKVTIENSNSQALWLSSSAAFSTTPQVKLRWAVRFNSSNNYSEVGSIVGFKNNATDGDGTGGLLFNTQSTNGGAVTERMRITSAGNVGIGTTSPISTFTISNNGNYTPSTSGAIGGGRTTRMHILGQESGLMLSSDMNPTTAASTGTQTYQLGLQIGFYAANDIRSQIYFGNSPLTFVSSSNQGDSVAERMRITSGGSVGIGTSSPTGLLQLNGSIANSADSSTFTIKQSGTSSTNGIYIERNGERNGYFMYIGGGVDSLTFRRNYFGTQSNVMSLTRDGNILLGTDTDNGERLYVGGSIRATGSITANSDARLKKNIERIENALEKVGQISGYTYNTIYDEDRHAGVIAQEIDKVLPEIVNKGNDGLMGVEYGNISALLIEAIKDLKKDNESLRAIVEGLRK